MGQLRSWYSQAQVVFVGGTLIDHGGQNPIEAAEQAASWSQVPRGSTSLKYSNIWARAPWWMWTPPHSRQAYNRP